MLGIAAGVGRRAFLRIGFWTAAGGILGHLVNTRQNGQLLTFFTRTAYLPRGKSTGIYMLCLACRHVYLWLFQRRRIGLRFWRLENLFEICIDRSGCQCSWHPGWIFHLARA